MGSKCSHGGGLNDAWREGFDGIQSYGRREDTLEDQHARMVLTAFEHA
jgi:hypothetical protein